MSGLPRQERFEEAEADATHYRTSMAERRNIGVKIVTGIAAFDLLVLKLSIDASDQTVRRSWAATWPLLGMLALTIGICWMAGLVEG